MFISSVVFLLVLGIPLLFGSIPLVGVIFIMIAIGLVIYKPSEENLAAWFFFAAIIGVLFGVAGGGSEPTCFLC